MYRANAWIRRELIQQLVLVAFTDFAFADAIKRSGSLNGSGRNIFSFIYAR